VVRQLDIDEAVFAMQVMPKVLGLGEEPMWEINKASIEKLKTLIEGPFQQFGGKDLYPSDVDKLTYLFYSVTKGHRLENGNKRTAVILMLMLLASNGYWVEAKSDEIYRLALEVAKSQDKKSAEEILNKFFIERMRRVSWFGLLRNIRRALLRQRWDATMKV